MNIGEAADASGVTAKMIRHYESIGLVRPAARSANGYRVYGDDDVHTLRFIRRARNLGFSIEEIGELLALWRDKDRASADVKRIALEHVDALERKAEELQQMARTLRHLARTCHGDDRPDCPIIDELARGRHQLSGGSLPVAHREASEPCGRPSADTAGSARPARARGPATASTRRKSAPSTRQGGHGHP